MDKKKIIIFTSLGVIALAAIIVLTVFLIKSENNRKKSDMKYLEFEELVALEKVETLNDLQDLQIRFEEEKRKVKDTTNIVFQQLEQERIHVQELYDELHKTKTTSAAEIKRLKKELKALREVLKDYSKTIVELQEKNKNLEEENKNLKKENKKVERAKKELEKEKKSLEEKVDIAAQLNATNTKIALLRSNGKETKKLKIAKDIRVSCTISRNVTANTGYKMAYVRIMQPDGEPLAKDKTRDIFKYNKKDMVYSMCKEFEHTGEEQDLVFYWDIAEGTLQPGSYHVSIIVDGNIIGEGSAKFE